MTGEVAPSVRIELVGGPFDGVERYCAFGTPPRVRVSDETGVYVRREAPAGPDRWLYDWRPA